VTAYLKNAGLLPYLEQLGFHVVAYGCTTCIGNSGPMQPEIEKAIKERDLVAAAVLSGNRNFEGRVHPLTKANYLCLAAPRGGLRHQGPVDIDLTNEPIGTGKDGQPVFLKDIWPSHEEIAGSCYLRPPTPPLYKRAVHRRRQLQPGLEQALPGAHRRDRLHLERRLHLHPGAPFLQRVPPKPSPLRHHRRARAGLLRRLHHHRPHLARRLIAEQPRRPVPDRARREPEDFNSYGARRGNHEVMMRGTFANIRIRNKLVEKEGGLTVYQPTGEECHLRRRHEVPRRGTPLVVLAGKMYGAGSSRDWAAKGTYLLGVKAVIAESFERIHRSNLVEMGVLPLEFTAGQTRRASASPACST
jgi:aconitate hydratase